MHSASRQSRKAGGDDAPERHELRKGEPMTEPTSELLMKSVTNSVGVGLVKAVLLLEIEGPVTE